MKTAAALLLCVFGLPAPQDTIKVESIEYKDGDVVLEGILAVDTAVKGKRPGVIVIHEWKGRGEYVKRRAEQLAKLGYAAFAIDMYGKGVYAKDHAEAGRLAGAVSKDRAMMRRRAAAGLEVLKQHESCDATRIAAMGYCFGGTTSIEMARAGLPLLGVASFHGNLSTPEPAKEVKAKVIVFHGDKDAFVPEEVVDAFHREMKAAKADYVVHRMADAVHSFTVKEAGDDPKTGMAYNEEADKKSWKMLEEFLAGLFKK